MRNVLSEIEGNMQFIDGFDEAIVGYIERACYEIVALYDKEKCLQILMKQSGISEIEAIEYFDHNIVGSYVGEYTPAFVTFLK